MNTYRIKPTRDGKFDLLQNGDWLGTYDSQVEAETERDIRVRFDKTRDAWL